MPPRVWPDPPHSSVLHTHGESSAILSRGRCCRDALLLTLMCALFNLPCGRASGSGPLLQLTVVSAKLLPAIGGEGEGQQVHPSSSVRMDASPQAGSQLCPIPSISFLISPRDVIKPTNHLATVQLILPLEWREIIPSF